jgi:hypothetical protein
MGLTFRQAVFFLLLAVTLVACAGFNYKYYGLEPVSYEGKLLGPKEKDDVPFKLCAPDPAIEGEPAKKTQGKCVVMFVDEFEKLRFEMVDMKERLKACEGK